MPDVSEGLSVGGSEPKGDAFTEALLAKLETAGGDPLDDTSTEAGAVEEPAAATGRDPETGRFIPKEEAAAADTPPPVPVADTSEDPAVAAYLQKYNGDTAAALKAAAEAQSVIGRQGQTIGETREELARLRGTVEAMQQAAATSPAGPVMSSEQLEEYAVEKSSRVGYFTGATELINEGNQAAYDVLLRNWAIEDPIAAQRYDLKYQLWQQGQQAPAPEEPGLDPRLSQVIDQQDVNAMADAIGVVASERGEQWAAIAPHMDAALEGMHPSILALVASQDPQDRLDGTRLIADRATLIAQSAAAPGNAADAAAAAATARKVAGAAVATGSLRPVAAEPGTPTSKSDAIAQFKRDLVATETTNVMDGLTYGK